MYLYCVINGTSTTAIPKLLHQELPYHSTIVLRELTHIAYALLVSRRSDQIGRGSDCDKHTCQRMLYFFITTQKIFYVKKNTFFKTYF